MDDLVDAIVTAVEKRAELPKETTLLLGERETMSYDDLQRKTSSLLFGKEMKTYPIPKIVAKIGAWVMDHTPFMAPSFIKPWMINFSDDNYNLDITRAKQVLGWDPKHKLQDTLPIMIKSLKEDPVKWYKDNQLNLPHWIQKQV
jgi:nucleoside-diphosphate-sugar epimerase